MNIAIPTYKEGSPVYYTIKVWTEVAQYEIFKRYSDFTEFVSQLELEMGEKTPSVLPGKKWIGGNSHEFLDDRRRQLELFLRNILRQKEWRESLAVQQFLEFSKHNKRSQRDGENGLSKDQTWTVILAETKKLVQSTSNAETTAGRRKAILQAELKVSELEKSLQSSEGIGEGEYRRRRDVISEINRQLADSKRIAGGVANHSDSGQVPGAYVSSRGSAHDQLIPKTRTRVLGGGGETDRTRGLNNQQLLLQQKEDMASQDEALETLAATIRKQRQLGEAIRHEVERQDPLLDEINSHVHETAAKLNQATRRTKKLH